MLSSAGISIGSASVVDASAVPAAAAKGSMAVEVDARDGESVAVSRVSVVPRELGDCISSRRLLNEVGMPVPVRRGPGVPPIEAGMLYDLGRLPSITSTSGIASSLGGTPRYGSAYTRWPRIRCGLA